MIKATTAQEVIDEVKLHGLNTDINNLNKIADIFGHSTEQTLLELAKHHKETFFLICVNIWDIDHIVQYYNNAFHIPYQILMVENQKLLQEKEELQEDNSILFNRFESEKTTNANLQHKIMHLETEVCRLKVLAFDQNETIESLKQLHCNE